MPQQVPQKHSNGAKAPTNMNASPPASSKLRPLQQRSRKRAPNPAIAPLIPPPMIPGQTFMTTS
jgi:hypothetical protein